MEEKMAPWNPVTRIAWALALLLAGGCTCGEQRPVGEPDDGSPTEPDDSGPGGDPGFSTLEKFRCGKYGLKGVFTNHGRHPTPQKAHDSTANIRKCVRVVFTARSPP